MIIPDLADTGALRRAYGTFPSGVTAVCALRDAAPVGIVASSFVAVSMNPPLVSVCVQHTSTTWPLLADRPRLGLSLLGETHEEACWQLASKTGDRFAGIGYTVTDEGAVLLHDAAAWLDCSIDTVVTAGDHDVVLLRVQALQTHPDVAPLVYQGSRVRSLSAPAS
ncbi:flavin reductase (DIM6/NTAB) family NADH-FMN oxidoreductase RutF [Amycolatopsis bartoniae]|uniref:Oxidoreductase n=1 Tax=Amycolatopsis bartoniae TaxID=941986 RepID=A0A8H9J361_9PSEU|nr:flavin reductase family protein [Amycolatopsis bartoniae]MBB2936582.1 flavin reductase (DIM6/NTAB) family NADH-FMN oxidoreductase RutF [Amycolatopsis bartoniae]TVT09831.1 flavin reductase family protein [Amycolatopsis bartoniae]GHF67899.1 oxidoreductase [Amycolatopsis bartoniae]